MQLSPHFSTRRFGHRFSLGGFAYQPGLPWAQPLARAISGCFRRSLAERMLAGLAAILALNLFVELLGLGLPPHPAPLPAQPGSGAAPAAESREHAVAGWLSTASARPLFNPDRTPFQEYVPPPPPPVLPRLAGIMVDGGKAFAIFTNPGGSPVVAAAGARIGAFKLTAIGADSIRVNGPNGQQRLQVDYRGDPAARAETVAKANTEAATAARAPNQAAWPSPAPQANPR